ncbi:MAG: phosphoserine phosphatase SerB [Actinobacteria bacterium]|nr:phosphoserine phosphatase SerB [Actinomycetota bacterium]
MRRTLLITVNGSDRPGVSSEIFRACGAHPVRVIDTEQLVIRGRLVLAVLLEGLTDDTNLEACAEHIREIASTLSMDVDVAIGEPENPDMMDRKFRVTILGAPLLPDAVSLVAREVATHGGNIDRIHRIADYPVTAIAFDGSGLDPDQIRRQLAEISSSSGVDIAIQDQSLEARGQYLVLLDVDSTVIQDEVIDLLAARADRLAEIAAITTSAMEGTIDFQEALRQRVALLAGLPAGVLDEVRDEITLTPGARTLCRTLKRLGYRIALVSGGFTPVIAPIGQDLGVDVVRANELEIADGRLTGRVIGPIIDRVAKREVLEELAATYQIPRRRTVAIGDGANDVDMLAAAGLGIAFNAKPVTREVADASVNVPYLDSVLFLLGITRAEIEEADARGGTPTPRP